MFLFIFRFCFYFTLSILFRIWRLRDEWAGLTYLSLLILFGFAFHRGGKRGLFSGLLLRSIFACDSVYAVLE